MNGIIESSCARFPWGSAENRVSESSSEAVHDFLLERGIQSTDHRGRQTLLGTLVKLTTSFG